jgi:L-ascorbate metabolism protein UlaG (beta-lactamase superfamily)
MATSSSRLIRRAAAAALASAGLTAAGWALRGVPAALGARPSGERAERVLRSPQFNGEQFQNAAPGRSAGAPSPGMLREAFFGKQQRRPRGEVPIVTPPPFGAAATGLEAIWFGHASTLVEMEGRRVLIDPVWSDRCSPASFAGPRRMHPVPLAVAQLPPLDAIVISHDHYDHLDMETVRELARTQSAPFLVPLGVGAHLARWRVPSDRIVELDWDESVTVAGLRFVATAAQHFSGRAFRRNDTLWGSWVIAGRTRKVFYTGDSGYFEGYAAIGGAHGPFDLALIQIGAYSPAWPDIHMTPEEAVEAHLDVRGGLLVPVHWATFNLAFHDWSEPVERLWREAKSRDVRLAVPRPGERIDVDAPPLVDGWWQAVA